MWHFPQACLSGICGGKSVTGTVLFLRPLICWYLGMSVSPYHNLKRSCQKVFLTTCKPFAAITAPRYDCVLS